MGEVFIDVASLKPEGPFGGVCEREDRLRRCRLRLADEFGECIYREQLSDLMVTREELKGAASLCDDDEWYLSIVTQAVDRLWGTVPSEEPLEESVRDLLAAHKVAADAWGRRGQEVMHAASTVFALKAVRMAGYGEPSSWLLPLRLLCGGRRPTRDAIDGVVEAALAGLGYKSPLSSRRAELLTPLYHRVAEAILIGDNEDVIGLLEEVVGVPIAGAGGDQGHLHRQIAAYRAYKVSLAEVCSAADTLWGGWGLAELARESELL